MRTEEDEIKLFEKLNQSGKLFQHRNRHGFIHFQKNGWVSFYEIHMEIVSFITFPFDCAIDGLLKNSYERSYTEGPDYEFEKIWVEPYTYNINELKQVLHEYMQDDE